MPKQRTKLRKRPGPVAETLTIKGNWKEAVRKALSKKRPIGGWPKPEKKRG